LNIPDTIHIFRTLGNTARVYKNAVSKEVVRLERRPGGADFNKDLKHLVSGIRGKKVRIYFDRAGCFSVRFASYLNTSQNCSS
jgi:hypothetical protein